MDLFSVFTNSKLPFDSLVRCHEIHVNNLSCHLHINIFKLSKKNSLAYTHHVCQLWNIPELASIAHVSILTVFHFKVINKINHIRLTLFRRAATIMIIPKIRYKVNSKGNLNREERKICSMLCNCSSQTSNILSFVNTNSTLAHQNSSTDIILNDTLKMLIIPLLIREF